MSEADLMAQYDEWANTCTGLDQIACLTRAGYPDPRGYYMGIPWALWRAWRGLRDGDVDPLDPDGPHSLAAFQVGKPPGDQVIEALRRFAGHWAANRSNPTAEEARRFLIDAMNRAEAGEMPPPPPPHRSGPLRWLAGLLPHRVVPTTSTGEPR